MRAPYCEALRPLCRNSTCPLWLAPSQDMEDSFDASAKGIYSLFVASVDITSGIVEDTHSSFTRSGRDVLATILTPQQLRDAISLAISAQLRMPSPTESHVHQCRLPDPDLRF